MVVEDEIKMASVLRRGLMAAGLAVDIVDNGEEAVWMAGATAYDSIVLDVMLPGIDGFETCRRLRAEGVWSPVLMLTARDGIADRVAGLDGGADDYMQKPFSFAELLARLRALARRNTTGRPVMLEVDDLRLDPASHRVSRAGTDVELSQKEFALLETFMRRPGEVLSPSWSTRGPTTTRTGRTSSLCMCGTCATRSIGPSASRRSRRSAAWVTGFERVFLRPEGSPQDSGVADRVAPRLWPYAEPVRARSHRDAVQHLAGGG